MESKNINDVIENIERKAAYLNGMSGNDAYEHGKIVGMIDGFEYCLAQLEPFKKKELTTREYIYIALAIFAGAIGGITLGSLINF